MESSIFDAVPLLIWLTWGIVWLFCLAEIVGTARSEWSEIGRNKGVWFLIVFFLQFFGTLFYLASVRPKLKR